MSCEHPNKIYEDVWLNPRTDKRGFYKVTEYYCPNCKETFTIPPTVRSDTFRSTEGKP